MIRIACPACDQMLRIPDSLGGRMVHARSARKNFAFPNRLSRWRAMRKPTTEFQPLLRPAPSLENCGRPLTRRTSRFPSPSVRAPKRTMKTRTPTQLNPNRVKKRPVHGVAAQAHRDADAGPYLASGTKTTTAPISALIAAASFSRWESSASS